MYGFVYFINFSAYFIYFCIIFIYISLQHFIFLFISAPAVIFFPNSLLSEDLCSFHKE